MRNAAANFPGPERESVFRRVEALLGDYRPDPEDEASYQQIVSALCVLEDSLHRRGRIDHAPSA